MSRTDDGSDRSHLSFAQQQISRRAFVQQTGMGLGAVMLLAACGNSASTSGAGPLNELKIGYGTEPGTLDPQIMQGVDEASVLDNIMEGLFALDRKNVPAPRLAESYRQLDDKTWQFKIRKGINFTNGEPLTADSVKFTYDRSRSTSLPIKNTYADDINLDQVEIVDDHTVNFHLTDPTPFILARMADDHLLFPPQYATSSGPATVAREPVGTGPYMLKEWASGSSLTLTPNRKYWGTPKPKISTVVFQIIPDASTRVNNLKTGAVQLINYVDPSLIPVVKGQSNLKVAATSVERRVYVGFNTKLKPMDDVRVRQAINYGTDVESICKTILAGTVSRMKTWAEIPYDDPNVKGYKYDPEKAKTLLQTAGFAGGLKITFDVDNSSYLGGSQFPEAIAASLEKVGITVAINRIDKAVAAANERKRQTHEMYLRSNAAYYDPDLTYNIWKLTQAGNGTQWNDSVFQGILKQALTGGTVAQRKDWSNQLQARLMDQAPALFLWKEPTINGFNTSVLKGFTPWHDEHFHLTDID